MTTMRSRAIRLLLQGTSRRAYSGRAFLPSQALLNVTGPQHRRGDQMKWMAAAALIGGMSIVCSAQALNQASSRSIQAEELYLKPSYDRRELLKFIHRAVDDAPQDVELLWRLARAAYDVASLSTTLPDEKKTLTYYARDTIAKALDLDDNNFAVHKWFGIILSSVGDFEGSKATIANSYIVRDHWLRAIELNPSDSTSHHLLGRWALTIADISWLERQVAAAIFGSPPTATYAQALDHFLQADAISPGFWKKNTLMIAQTYLKMRDKAKAKEWVEKALTISSSTEEDNQVHKEALALLATL
ncbi:hypothetical protein Ae201684_009786 [Aphanomyces euteiches]|uniref:Regulator of microtubule dynamics protein 1 n=1 Tax=Aphanomyces euteiches TaxID=100861 RepID=A0A6G0X102_9STRA|nr:hypothetical protein Ae201684_009786 [Aphanomyces euteiches]KAH9149886.1 hypothetical protein AeRB84_007175 [Aphanomyces euteiches]